MKNAPLRTIDDYFITPDVHDVQREQRGGLLTLLVSAVVCVVEGLFLYWVLADQLSFALGFFLHIVLVVLLGVYARALFFSGGENRFALLLLLTTATTGLFGAAGVFLTVLTSLWFTRKALPFEAWFDTMFPHLPRSQSQRIYDDILIGRDESSKSYSVIPFLDVMSFGSEVQKRQALAKMTSNFHPNFAPAFKKALNDPSNMIRVQAATAITKIETLFLERLMKLTAVKLVHGDDPVVVLALAEHYDSYAYTGLLDYDREQANRQKALEHYYEYLHLEPGSADVRTRIGRILMRNKEYEKAADWFRSCMDLGYVTEAVSEWYSEALFALGRYAELRRYRASQSMPVADNTALQPALREALILWSVTPSGDRA